MLVAMAAVVMGPGVCAAQVRSVGNDERVFTAGGKFVPGAMEQWEDALATRVTDPDTWNAIGQRLYAAERYRECIAAFEQSLVKRKGHSREEADFIARAYEKLGNAKQASRWSEIARGIMDPSGRRARIAV